MPPGFFLFGFFVVDMSLALLAKLAELQTIFQFLLVFKREVVNRFAVCALHLQKTILGHS